MELHLGVKVCYRTTLLNTQLCEVCYRTTLLNTQLCDGVSL